MCFDFDPTILRVVPVIAIAEQGHSKFRRGLGLGEIVDDCPKLLPRRIDQAVHRATGIETDRQLDDTVFGPAMRYGCGANTST